MGLANAPEIAECDASTSFVFPPGLPNAPEMSERLGLSELVFTCGGHVVRDKIESLGCCLMSSAKASVLTLSSFGLNSEFYFSLKYILMVEKSPALICAWEVFQFLGQSSRNCRPL